MVHSSLLLMRPSERASEQILFCGFGKVSEACALLRVQRKLQLDQLSALTDSVPRYDSARVLGVDTIQVATLTAASIVAHARLKTSHVIIEIDDDARLVRMLLALKPQSSNMKITAVAADPDVSRTLTVHGLSEVVCIAQLNGQLLAQTVLQPQARLRSLS